MGKLTTFVGLILFSNVAHAAGKIIVTLDGKPVTQVPVDKLPQLQFKVESSVPYKAAYKKEWGKLQHALEMVVKGGGPSTRIEFTGADKGWFNKKASTPKTEVVLRQLQFYRYDTTAPVTIGVYYERQYYT